MSLPLSRSGPGTHPARPEGNPDIQNELAALERAQLFRVRKRLASAQGPVVQIEEREYLNFCSNDYLSLAADPRIAAALAEGARRWGCGAGASSLVCGYSDPHAALEQELCGWLGRDRAVLFSSGYLANLAVVSALAPDRSTLVAEDRLNHASLIDAARLAGARLRRYRHADPAHLREILAADNPRKLVLTDGLFSMDGDFAPVKALVEECQRTQAILVVDDAHGLGVLGENGAGTLERHGLGQREVPLLVGTFGKALGCAGAFVAGTDLLIETLVQRARTYIYTTALSPALATAVSTSLAIVREGQALRRRLEERIACFRERAAAAGIALTPAPAAIQPVILGSPEAALRWSEHLFARGVLVTAIRPPTVPRGTSRLRITLCAGHEEAQIDQLVEALVQCLPAR